MATRREVLEYVIRINGDNNGDLQRLVNQLGQLENRIESVQAKAAKGYVINSSGTAAKLGLKYAQAEASIAGQFLGVTNAKDLRGYKDPGVLNVARMSLLGLAGQSTAGSAEEKAAIAAANAVTTRINQLERDLARRQARMRLEDAQEQRRLAAERELTNAIQAQAEEERRQLIQRRATNIARIQAERAAAPSPYAMAGAGIGYVPAPVQAARTRFGGVAAPPSVYGPPLPPTPPPILPPGYGLRGAGIGAVSSGSGYIPPSGFFPGRGVSPAAQAQQQLLQLQNLASSIAGNTKNQGLDLTAVLGRDKYNQLFGLISQLQANQGYLSPYDQARMSEALRSIGVGGFSPTNNRNIGGFNFGYRSSRNQGLGFGRSVFEGLKYSAAGIGRGLGSAGLLLGPSLGLAAAYGISRGITTGLSGSLGAFGQIQGQELFLGGSLGNFFNFGEGLSASENLTQARRYAADTLVPAVRETAIASPLTYQELFEGYARSSPILFNKGLDPQQALRLTNRIYSVGKASGIRPASIIDDLRALNTGIIRNAQTFQAAGVGQKEFSELSKLRGDELVEALDKIFEPFDETIAEYENTYEGKMARLSDSIFTVQVAIGEALAPVIEELATDITKLINAAEDNGTLQNFADGLAGIISVTKNMVTNVLPALDKALGVLSGAGIGTTLGVVNASGVGAAINFFTGGKLNEFATELPGIVSQEGLFGTFANGLVEQGKLERAQGNLRSTEVTQATARRAAELYVQRTYGIGPGQQGASLNGKPLKLGVGDSIPEGTTYTSYDKLVYSQYTKELKKISNAKSSSGASSLTPKDRPTSGDEEAKAKVGVIIPNLPGADFDFVSYDKQQFAVDVAAQNIDSKLRFSSSYINDALATGNYATAKNLLNEQLGLITQRTNLAKKTILDSSAVDKIRYNIDGAREAAGNQPLGVDPFGQLTGAGILPPVSGPIGGSSDVIRGSRAEADSARQRANDVKIYNDRLQEIRNFNLNEQKRQLEILKLETDLQFETYNIKKQIRDIAKQELINGVRLSRAGNINNLSLAAGAYTASPLDGFKLQDALLEQELATQGIELGSLINPFNPLSSVLSDSFGLALAGYAGLQNERTNLRRNFLFNNASRNRGIFTSGVNALLDRRSSSIYTTRQGQQGVLRSRIALLEGEYNAIRGVDSSRERAFAIQNEIASINQQLNEEEVVFGFNRDNLGFQRRLSLDGVTGISRQRQVADIRQSEVADLLNKTTPGEFYNTLQSATDPQLRAIAQKYKGASAFRTVDMEAVREQLKNISIRDSRRTAVLANREEAFNFRLQNQSSDFVSYLNGGTGNPTVQQAFDRKLQEIRFSINEQIPGTGSVVDALRAGAFRTQTTGLRSQFFRDKATESLRTGGGIALAALAAGGDPLQAFISSTPSPIDAGQSFATLFSKNASSGDKGLAAQNLGALVGTYIAGQAFPNSYSGEGSVLGGLVGTALGGPAGAALGTLGGALFGGLFGKKKGPSPEDEARRRFQERLIDLVSGINKSLQQAPDFFRAFSREAIMGSPSRHYSGRAYSDLNMQYNRGSI